MDTTKNTMSWPCINQLLWSIQTWGVTFNFTIHSSLALSLESLKFYMYMYRNLGLFHNFKKFRTKRYTKHIVIYSTSWLLWKLANINKVCDTTKVRYWPEQCLGLQNVHSQGVNGGQGRVHTNVKFSEYW